jgi:predicted Fe-Mo cluster-binding NifX family protein
MRLCIPTQTKDGKTASVHEHFGSAPYFTIYDTDKDTAEVISNSNEHHSHGMCQPLQALAGQNIDATICGGIGPGALMRLNEGGIKAYRAIPGTVGDIVSQFSKGALQEITIDNACNHDHGCH